jgi:hypothetical protein
LVNTAIGDQRYDRCMSSDLPPGAFPADRGQHWGPPPPGAAIPSALSPAAPPSTFARPPRWPALIALPIALIALAVSIVGWFRPTSHSNEPPTKPTYSDQQTAEAKQSVCTAYESVRQAVSVNTGRNGGDDPTAVIAVAANARIALYDGGDYLLKVLNENPATPPDLDRAARALTNAYQQMAINYLANAPDPQQQASRDTVEKANTTVYGICK